MSKTKSKTIFKTLLGVALSIMSVIGLTKPIFAADSYTITASDDYMHGGSTSVPSTATTGETVTINYTLPTGYEISSIQVVGGSENALVYHLNSEDEATITKVSDTQFTFTMPAHNVNISTITTQHRYKITGSATNTTTNETKELTGGNGYYNQEIIYTLFRINSSTPDSITIKDTSGNDISYTIADDKITFTMPASDISLHITYHTTVGDNSSGSSSTSSSYPSITASAASTVANPNTAETNNSWLIAGSILAASTTAIYIIYRRFNKANLKHGKRA